MVKGQATQLASGSRHDAGQPDAQKRVAIAGLGAAARQIHLPACAKLRGLSVVGGLDPACKNGEFSFPVFSCLGEMLDRAKPDLLIVATPPESHYELVRQGLLSGCHVLCEKPFMPDIEHAAEIVALAATVNRRVVVNNQYRFMNIHAEARRRVGTPEFGDLLFLSVQQTFLTSEVTEHGWRGQETRRTCKEFGTHVFDLCRFFFDDDPVAITARMPKPNRADGPDYLNLIQLEFSGDRVAHITLDRLCRGPHRYLSTRLDGSEGYIETTLGGGVEFRAGIRGGSRRPFVNLDVSMGGSARLYHGEKSSKIASDPLDLFAHATSRLLQEFIQAIDHDVRPPCSAEDNCRTLALMLAAYESDEKRMTIDMTKQLQSLPTCSEAPRGVKVPPAPAGSSGLDLIGEDRSP